MGDAIRSDPRFAAILLLQIFCASLFILEVLVSHTTDDFPPLMIWGVALTDIIASIGLLLGIVFGARFIVQLRHRASSAAQALGVAKGAFYEITEEKFTTWKFT